MNPGASGGPAVADRSVVLQFLRRYALRYSAWFAVGVLALLATNWLTILLPRLLQQGIDALATAEAAAVVRRSVIWMLAASVAIVLVRTLSRLCFFNPGRAVEYRLRVHLLTRLLEQPSAFHDRWTLGELMSRSSNDLQDVRALTGFASLQAVNVVIAVPMAVYGMATLHGWVTIACGVPLAISVAIMRYAAGAVRGHYFAAMEDLATLSSRILGAYSGVGVIAAYRAQPQILDAFDLDNEAYIGRQMKIATIRSFLLPVITVAGNLCILVVLWYGGAWVVAKEMSVGEIAAFLGYVAILVTALGGTGWLIDVLQRGSIALRRIFEVLDAPLEVAPFSASLPSVAAAGRALEVRDLTFAYEGARGPVLRNVSFRLSPGQTLGIFGPSGAGKSTLLRLLCRQYEPPPGSVFLDGVDVSTLSVDELRGEIALVPQSPFLFSESVAENVAFGRGADPVDPDRVREAVAAAQLADDVAVLPDGIHTTVGERGVLLSGGQRQRTALARALYLRGYRLLLLDDVLSAVDQRTERAIVAALAEHASGVTRVVVSHRLSALRRADRILVMEAGQVREAGTHDELILRPGPYAEAWEREMREAEEDVATLSGNGDGHG